MYIGLALLEALKQQGACEIFGIPGDFALPFFKVIEESQVLPLYTLSHEPGVGFAADAAARLHAGLGVAVVTYGAGALNMVNAVAAAYAEKSPLVVISGAPGIHERSTGLLLHHQVKSLDLQFAIFREITCDQAILSQPQTAPAAIARVLQSCQVNSRPVYIELPRDQVFESCEAVPALPPAIDYDQEALQACVDEILNRLQAAQAPMLMVGVEIRRYNIEAKVAQLARKLGVPVVTSFMGRGLLTDADAPLIGTYMGLAGDETLTQQVESSDALLMLGVIMSDTNLGVSQKQIARRYLIDAADGQVSLGFHTYPHMPLSALVDALLKRLGDDPPLPPPPAHHYPRHLPIDEAPITPTDIATAVNDFMADYGRMPIASDIGDCLFTALDMENTELVAPGYYATMGFGIPAGLGVQAATGRRPLILVGDGAFQMTGWELGNCRRYGWDPIVILFNNSSWEMLRTFQPASEFNNLDDWHFAALAEGLGGRGVRVATRVELKQALDQAAQERGRFQLIEVMLQRGVISKTLDRFATGIKRLHGK